MSKQELVTVKCPICGEVVEIPQYDSITRSDALLQHIAAKHAVGMIPNLPTEGPPLPRGLNIRWPRGGK